MRLNNDVHMALQLTIFSEIPLYRSMFDASYTIIILGMLRTRIFETYFRRVFHIFTSSPTDYVISY